MLSTLLKCPNKFVSSNFLKQTLDRETKIKTYGLKAAHLESDLHCNGYDVTLTTNRYFVWEFWRCLINSPYHLLKSIEFFHLHLKTRDISTFRNKWYTKFENPYERAALYYLFNRYSKDGELSCQSMSKHNFSKLNIRTFENLVEHSRDLNLSFTSHEDLTNSFDEVDDNTTILIPIGKHKRDFILKKEVVSIDTSNYNFEKISQYLNSTNKKMILVFKFDQYIDRLFENTIYINKFGEITEHQDLAEDLIAMNYSYE